MLRNRLPNRNVPKLDESLLSGLPPFSRLRREQIREILDHATSRRYEEGGALFREGHDADRFRHDRNHDPQCKPPAVAWEKDGLVESTRKHIVVTDPHRLVLVSGAQG